MYPRGFGAQAAGDPEKRGPGSGGAVGRSLGSQGQEPRAGEGRAKGPRWPLPCPEAAGRTESRRVLAPGPGPSPDLPPRSWSLEPGACSRRRRRLRCQQTSRASLPGPPPSNSEQVPPTGFPQRTQTLAAESSGMELHHVAGCRWRGLQVGPPPLSWTGSSRALSGVVCVR